jgi:hypothetical protein
MGFGLGLTSDTWVQEPKLDEELLLMKHIRGIEFLQWKLNDKLGGYNQVT